MAFAALPAAAHVRIDAVARVRRAMGGALLDRVQAIGWSGTATVSAGGRVLHLGVETRVEPFVRARSDSWILAEGRSALRTLMIERDGGFAVVNGAQRALPAAQVEHERQQYGLYGLMLFREATLRSGGIVESAHMGLRSALFRPGSGGLPEAAEYTVDAPDGNAPIRERCLFTGAVGDKGVTWPRKIVIVQEGKPFFALTIDTLHVELLPIQPSIRRDAETRSARQESCDRQHASAPVPIDHSPDRPVRC